MIPIIGPIDLGHGSYASHFATIQDTEFGKFTSIGAHAIIGAQPHPLDWMSTHPFQYLACGALKNIKTRSWPIVKTFIGNDVWIGAGAIILAGVTIGDGAVIGAGAVVRKDVAPYAIMAGVPAKLIRYRFDPETIAALLETKWWDLPLEQIQSLPFDDVHACLAKLKGA